MQYTMAEMNKKKMNYIMGKCSYINILVRVSLSFKETEH